MAKATSIEWTEMTWNPVTGCTEVSSGCANCYAERMAKRLQAMRAPRRVFVNSMSDLFHKNVPLEFIERVFDVMARCPQHQFQILTKRSSRLRSITESGALNWPANVWTGVSVEDQRRVRRENGRAHD